MNYKTNNRKYEYFFVVVSTTLGATEVVQIPPNMSVLLIMKKFEAEDKRGKNEKKYRNFVLVFVVLVFLNKYYILIEGKGNK